jgi:hypothetical protein
MVRWSYTKVFFKDVVAGPYFHFSGNPIKMTCGVATCPFLYTGHYPRVSFGQMYSHFL